MRKEKMSGKRKKDKIIMLSRTDFFRREKDGEEQIMITRR